MSLLLDDHPVEAVVFDFDGVLADTAHGWAVAEAALCAHYGLAYTQELAAATHGVGMDDAVRLLTAGLQPPVAKPEATALMRGLAAQHVPTHLTPMAGASAAVSALARHVPVAIASNTERPLLEQLVAALGLERVVREVVAATDVPSPKPAPDIYREAARRLGAAPEHTLAIEDSPTGGRAAAAAGCLVVALRLPDAPTVPDLSWASLHVGSHADLLARTRTASTRSARTATDPKDADA